MRVLKIFIFVFLIVGPGLAKGQLGRIRTRKTRTTSTTTTQMPRHTEIGPNSPETTQDSKPGHTTEKSTSEENSAESTTEGGSTVEDTTKKDIIKAYTTEEHNAEEEDTSENKKDYTESEVTTEVTKATTLMPNSTEVTTHTSLPISTQAPSCQPGETLFSEYDLNSLIDYVVEQSKVFDLVKNSYYENAVNMCQRYENNIENFLSWFTNKPLHLKHILKNLELSFNKIQNEINRIEKEISHSKGAVTQLHETSQRVKGLYNETVKTQRLCEAYCLTSQNLGNYVYRVQDQDQAPKLRSFCGNISEVYNRVLKSMQTFSDQTIKELEFMLEADENSYKEKTESWKNMLKDIALKEFGRIMYDILAINDDYYHLEDFVKSISVSQITHSITENIASSYKTWYDLREKSYLLRQKCLDCKDSLMAISHMKHHPLSNSYIQDLPDLVNPPQDLLDLLLDEHRIRIQDKILDDFEEIFKNLDEELSFDEAIIQKHVDVLKPIQMEVAELTEAEYKIFKKLNESVPTESLKNFDDMIRENREITENLQTINMILDKITAYVNI